MLLKFHVMISLFGNFGKLIFWNLFWYKIDMFDISDVLRRVQNKNFLSEL